MKTVATIAARAFCAALAGFATMASLHAQQDPARSRLAALIQEGDLLQQQAATLEPTTQANAREGSALLDAQARLTDDVSALETELHRYNQEVRALGDAAAEQRSRCGGVMQEAAAAEACNDAGDKIAADAAALEQRRIGLEARQNALNARIDAHNTARSRWESGKREHDGRKRQNDAEIRGWLKRARGFWSSEAFQSLVTAAGKPASCAQSHLLELEALQPVDALKKMQQCFKALGA